MEQEAKLNIVFMGTPEFGAIILRKLIENNYKPVLVVTAPDKPVGRKQILTPPPVKILAEEYGISVLQTEKLLTISNLLSAINPDLIVVAAYGQILPKEILEIPKYGSLNVHPSLLPRWRGASPIQFTILAGDKETGVTIILMDEKMDHGPIITNEKYKPVASLPVIAPQLNKPVASLPVIAPQLNKPVASLPVIAPQLRKMENGKWIYKKLESELANLGAKLLFETIPKWIKGEIKPIPQDESKATYTKILKKEDGRINWGKSAEEIERQIRAFNPWPGSYCFWFKDDKYLRLKILKAEVRPQENCGPFGIRGKTFLAPNTSIAVQTKKDFLIIKELQLEGKKPKNSEEFLMGYPNFIGQILE